MNRARFFIEPDELENKLGSPNFRIYDATIVFAMGMSPEEAAKLPTAYQLYQAGHIPGAAFFDHDTFTDLDSDYEYIMAADAVIEKRIGELGISNDSEVVVYASGPMANATRAWWLLRYAGVENMRVLNGGLNAWKRAGKAVEQEENHYPPATFKASFRPEMFASKDEVQAAMDSDEVVIEDALPQDWHDREHIPGSRCLPLTDLTDETWEVLLPDEQIRERMKDVETGARLITYCGGGIAATTNAVVHLMMGNENVAVYDGSLFEWMGEGLPIASNKVE